MSVKVTLSMPEEAAKRLQVQIDNKDPRLAAWMKEHGILGIGVVLPTPDNEKVIPVNPPESARTGSAAARFKN